MSVARGPVLLLLSLISNFLSVNAAFDLGYADDSDLTHFFSRPEIRVPRFNVTKYYPDEVVPGYWFLAPYASITQAPQPYKYYQACSTGPAIYDQDGELIWTGACQFKNQNACDFRAWRANGTDYLSMIFPNWDQVENYKGYGMIMNSSFKTTQEVHVPKLRQFFNMHEFNIVDNSNGGKSALHIGQRPVVVDLDLLDQDFEDLEAGLIGDLSINEIDLSTGEQVLEWWSSDHISPSESSAIIDTKSLEGPWPGGWNWLHLNSVDKNEAGDYMISSRYTDSIYKVSGRNGSLLWTLSGQPENARFSSFKMEAGFNFSRQHDARFVSETETTETITLLDNGGDENKNTSLTSSSLVVTLDKSDMTARVTKRWTRPDNKRSMLRGNFQLLQPSNNAFTGWSDNARISEHDWDGRLLMEAVFASERFVTYRTWKANFTGAPTEPPALKTYVYGTTLASSTTVLYVSWNGATEVASWNFLRVNGAEEEVFASKRRTGFETTIQIDGYEAEIVAEAVGRDGKVLGRSQVVQTEVTSDSLLEEINDLPGARVEEHPASSSVFAGYKDQTSDHTKTEL